MTAFHRYLGMLIVVMFLTMMVTGMVLRIRRLDETPAGVWALQHWTENLLVIQALSGIVLLILGRRASGTPDAWLHYLYGSLFPLVAVVGGRLAGLRRGTREYVGLAWGAFFAAVLTMRGVQTACGASFAELSSCLLR